MTRDQIQSVHDDIAYMKALAQEGRRAPILVGPVLVAAAVIFGLATFGQWMMVLGRVPSGGWASLALWLGAAAIFTVVLFGLIRRIETASGARTVGNQAIGAAWSCVGYGIFATWAGLLAYGYRTGQWDVMALMPTVVLVAYGSAWMVAAAIGRKAWLNLVGMASYAGAVVMAGLAGDQLLYPVYLALLIGVALVPGLVLMRQASPRAV